MSRTLNISEVVDNVIGHTDVWCDTNYDSESFNNMKEVEALLYHLVDKVKDNYKYKDRHEHSAQLLSKQARDILLNIKEELIDIE